MMTVRQIERDWDNRRYEKLFAALVENRPEGSFPFEAIDTRSTPAAAIAIIRLDELSQGHVPLYARLVRALLASQNVNDGGWGDPVVTALCLRALNRPGSVLLDQLHLPSGSPPIVNVAWQRYP